MFDFFLIWTFDVFMTFLFVPFRPVLKRGHLIRDIMQTFLQRMKIRQLFFVLFVKTVSLSSLGGMWN